MKIGLFDHVEYRDRPQATLYDERDAVETICPPRFSKRCLLDVTEHYLYACLCERSCSPQSDTGGGA